MGSRDRPVSSDRIGLRLPPELRLMVEALSVQQCSTLSDTIVRLIETHPVVLYMAERVYTVMDSPPDGKVTPP